MEYKNTSLIFKSRISRDILRYLYLNRFKNSNILSISKDVGSCYKNVHNCIKSLKINGYINIHQTGSKNGKPKYISLTDFGCEVTNWLNNFDELIKSNPQ